MRAGTGPAPQQHPVREVLIAVASADPVPQDLPHRRWRLAALLRRSLLTLLVTGQTVVAGWFMLSVLPYRGGNGVEIAMLVLFALLFAWISFGFWIAVAG